MTRSIDDQLGRWAGHGSQTPDRTGEETDGMAETILPCDFKTSGQITDAELNRILINPLLQVQHVDQTPVVGAACAPHGSS